MTDHITYTLNRNQPVLALVLPCFNEEEVIGSTIARLLRMLDQLIYEDLVSPDSFMMFVDDGSSDSTIDVIRRHKSRRVKAIRLSANVGHQLALLAGLEHATTMCDCAISLDADLQDDIGIIPEMIADFKKGAHIVYGIRDGRKSDSAFKRNTAHFYYAMMQRMGVNLIYNHADFRLMSNIVLRQLTQYREVNLFLRGIFPKMGFTATYLYYERKERTAGISKYPFRKMVALAVNGITSFTNLPLQIITWTGFIVFIGSLGLSAWALLESIKGNTVPGWTSITLPVYFIGGIQLLALGVIGEYVGKIYLETKRRPRYHIEEYIGHPRQRNDQAEYVQTALTDL